MLTNPIEQLAVLPFADIIPWLQMLEFVPLFAKIRYFKHTLDNLVGRHNKYEQKHQLIMKWRSLLVWSPTNLNPFEMYMASFYRALKTGSLKEGQDLVNDFCAQPEYRNYTTNLHKIMSLRSAAREKGKNGFCEE